MVSFCSEIDLVSEVGQRECERTRFNLAGKFVELMAVITEGAGCIDMLYGPLM